MARRPATTTTPEDRAAGAHRGVPIAKWVGQPVVVCEGGPLANRWYFADWWKRQVDSATDLVARGGQRSSMFLEYVATDASREHPNQPTRGQVLRWTGRKGARRG